MTSIWPSIIFIALVVVSFGIKLGESKIDITDLIANAIVFSLLYWGNFFEPIVSKLG